MRKKTKFLRVRYESFGGITSSSKAPFYKILNKDEMAKLGLIYAKIWTKPKKYLTSPAVVEFSDDKKRINFFRRYLKQDNSFLKKELPYSVLKSLFYELNTMGVFHISFNGNSYLQRDDFPKIINYCKSLDLTTSLMVKHKDLNLKQTETLKNIHNIILIVNNITPSIELSDSHCLATKIKFLKNSGINVSLANHVSYKNYKNLENLFLFASKFNVRRVKLIRQKPEEPNSFKYPFLALSEKMIKEFYPLIKRFSTIYKIRIKTDCSFVPALAFHDISIEEIKEIADTGCEGGNYSISAKPDGTYSACPYIKSCGNLGSLKNEWDKSVEILKFRSTKDILPQPCRECKYLSVCKGGCRAIAINRSKSFFQPDPECPFVVDYLKDSSKI